MRPLPGEASGLPSPRLTSGRRFRPVLASFVIGGLVIIGNAVWVMSQTSHIVAPADVVRFAIHDTDQVIVSRVERDMALSPDGRRLAFFGFGDGGPRLWIRALDSLEARPLAGTEGAVAVCWSPDGHALAFSALGRIYTIAIAGGPPREIATSRMNTLTGFAWGSDGTIVYAGLRGVWTVKATGGASTNVLPVVSDETYDSAVFLPDARHALIAIRGADPAKAGTFAVAIDGGRRTRILEFPTAARYAMGRLMFVRDRVLYAQAFDAMRLQLAQQPVPLAESVAEAFSVSERGAVAYLPQIPSKQTASTQLAWMDRGGRVVGRIDQAAGASGPALSPDGRRLAMSLRGDIWILELARGVLSRATSGDSADFSPIWLPDSQRVLFHRALFRGNKDAILAALIGSAAKETVVFEPGDGDDIHAHPTDVSWDGQYLAYETGDQRNVWVRALAGDPGATEHGDGRSAQTQGVFSPDARWLVYTSDWSGRFEVYVDGVPDSGTRVQVSTNGGSSARWRRDGKELFYLAPDGTLMAVPVRPTSALEFGQPTALFQFFSPNRGAPGGKPSYDVAPDGQRFIVSSVVRQHDPSIQVLLNWPALMAKTAP